MCHGSSKAKLLVVISQQLNLKELQKASMQEGFSANTQILGWPPAEFSLLRWNSGDGL